VIRDGEAGRRGVRWHKGHFHFGRKKLARNLRMFTLKNVKSY